MGLLRTGICCSNAASSESFFLFSIFSTSPAPCDVRVQSVLLVTNGFCGTTRAYGAAHLSMPQPWMADYPNSHTKPGGYFEFHDYDAELKSATGTPLTPANSDLAQWWSFVVDAASKSGRPFQIATSMKERVEKAG